MTPLLLTMSLGLAHGSDAPSIQAGPFTVTPVYHGTVMVQHGDTTLWIDPWSKAKKPLTGPKADVLLITDVHFDHLDEDAIAAVVDADTKVVGPKAVKAKRDEAGKGLVDHVLANGENTELSGITITAVPMYNLTRGPEEGGVFHEKGRGNGYILEADGVRVYIAGDTACTSEMKSLENIDLALIPMNLPYTMPPDEAAGCVAAFKPKTVVPYHYAGSDLAVFEGALAKVDGVEVKRMDAYPGGLPW